MQIILDSFWVILLICINIFTIFGGLVIKFNDMKHLKDRVNWICSQLDKFEKEQIQQGKDISALKTKVGI